MRKTILLVLVSIVFFIPSCKKKYKLSNYTNDKLKFEIKFPHEWIVSNEFPSVAALFVAPQIDSNDNFTESISIVFESFKDTTIKFDLNMYEKNIQASIQSYKKVAHEKFEINGQDSDRLIFTGAIDNKFQSFDQIYYVTEKGVFIITYTSVPDTYESYKKLFEQCVETFKLK